LFVDQWAIVCVGFIYEFLANKEKKRLQSIYVFYLKMPNVRTNCHPDELPSGGIQELEEDATTPYLL
jgi:hypothetical protein